MPPKEIAESVYTEKSSIDVISLWILSGLIQFLHPEDIISKENYNPMVLKINLLFL